ncbi:MAG: LysR family transcriptional regulator [Eggerthellaceae bacterium]|nr:LysR family transcriptional regulator [Eggerthellaceae bacterium]
MNTSPFAYVLAVVRHKSFSRAADSIPISQQGLSKSIAKLESDLGITLFKREGRTVTLTEEAAKLLPLIERLAEAEDDLLAKAADLRGAKAASETRVTVFSSAFFALGLLKELDEELAARGFPKTTILEADTPEAIQAIKLSPADTVAIANIPLVRYNDLLNDESVVFEELFSSQLVAMASPKFFPPRKRTISARDMRSLPLSYPNYSVLNEMASELFDHYHPSNVVFCTSNVGKIDKSVAAGESVALTDTIISFLRRDDADHVFVKFDFPIWSNVGFLYARCNEGMDARKGCMDAISDYMHSMLGPYIKKNPPIRRGEAPRHTREKQ